MRTPMSEYSSLLVGSVDSVSPDEIVVLLDTDAPQSTALNTGIPTAFPQVNGYILIPNQAGAIVGFVFWLGVERSPFPKRKGYSDFGLIDLPFPLRKLRVTPIGTLITIRDSSTSWTLERGVFSFPSVGDTVVVPNHEQLKAIISGDNKTDASVSLGTCPSAYNSDVRVDPNVLFGRHLAVLGNTGSGKSCTVASVIDSMIGQAGEYRNGNPNARFIILDPNGEYSECFKDTCQKVRVFRPDPNNDDLLNGVSPLYLPAWMWNSSEWASIAQAAPKIQRPVLQEALRRLRSNILCSYDSIGKLTIRTGYFIHTNNCYMNTGTNSYGPNKAFGTSLEKFKDDLSCLTSYFDGINASHIESCIATLNNLITKNKWPNNNGFDGFSANEVQEAINAAETLSSNFPQVDKECLVNEDSPVPFDSRYLAESLDEVSSSDASSSQQFISTLIVRIKSLINDQRISPVISSGSCTLEHWLNEIIGNDKASNGQIAVVDLSLIPYEVLHLTIAVAGRIIFEALQRYMKSNKVSLPTVLVLEEAHTFISRSSFQNDEIPTPAAMCRFTFERIAREGRKFGLGLIVSSQRPSEVSESVLSQCNTFMIHRITNDKDQDIVNRLVPDTARGLLRELPSLPTRHCIMLGAAVKIPVMLEIPALPENKRPRSEDPKFWEVWTGSEERQIDWKGIADEWQGTGPNQNEIDEKETTQDDDVPF